MEFLILPYTFVKRTWKLIMSLLQCEITHNQFQKQGTFFLKYISDKFVVWQNHFYFCTESLGLFRINFALIVFKYFFVRNHRYDCSTKIRESIPCSSETYSRPKSWIKVGVGRRNMQCELNDIWNLERKFNQILHQLPNINI